MQGSKVHNKGDARRIAVDRLNSIDDQEFKNSSQVVCRNLSHFLHGLYARQPFNSVLSYKAQSSWREIDVKPLEQEFQKVRFEYTSPHTSAPLPRQNFDLILVPMLGYNNQNYRLGRGGGWYDRLLSQQSGAIVVGVGLSASLIEFAAEPHDISVSYLITESTSR